MYAFAISTAHTANDAGIPVTVVEGEVWLASDPIVKGNPNLFADEPKNVRYSVAPKKSAANK